MLCFSLKGIITFEYEKCIHIQLFVCTIYFIFQFETKVKSCTPSELTVPGKKKEKVQGYEVILEDTILFPEGGGQVRTHIY